MVDMCREKKTGMAEECRESDGKWVLWACTECSILLGASGVLSKVVWHDHALIFLKMSRAALFWIFCMRVICSSATPVKVALQYSNLDVIIDTTSFFVELLDRNRQIDAILLSARDMVRQRLLMCCFIDGVWSRCTPRYIMVVWKGMQLPPISADSQPTELIRTDEPTSIISVFSVFSFSLLLFIHDKVSLIQDWMLDWAEVKSQGGAVSEISVSSAYLW